MQLHVTDDQRRNQRKSAEINPKKLSRSSRGLGHRPFTAVTGVRLPYGTPHSKPAISSLIVGFFMSKI